MRHTWIQLAAIAAVAGSFYCPARAQTYAPLYYVQPGAKPTPVTQPQLHLNPTAPSVGQVPAILPGPPPGEAQPTNTPTPAAVRAPASQTDDSLHGPWVSYRMALVALPVSNEGNHSYESYGIVAGWEWGGLLIGFEYASHHWSYSSSDLYQTDSFKCYGPAIAREWDIHRGMVRLGTGLSASYCKAASSSREQAYYGSGIWYEHSGEVNDLRIAVPVGLHFSPGEVFGRKFGKSISLGLVAQPEIIVPKTRVVQIPFMLTLESHLTVFGG